MEQASKSEGPVGQLQQFWLGGYRWARDAHGVLFAFNEQRGWVRASQGRAWQWNLVRELRARREPSAYTRLAGNAVIPRQVSL